MADDQRQVYAVTVDEKEEDMFADDWGVSNSYKDEMSFREELDNLSKSLNRGDGNLGSEEQQQHTEDYYRYDVDNDGRSQEEQCHIDDDLYYCEQNDETSKRTRDQQANYEDFSMISFREELDNLTKSLENGVNLDELFDQAKQVQEKSSETLETCVNGKMEDTSKMISSFPEKNPASSSTPLRSTPVRRTLPPRVKGTPEPPTPVKTPATAPATADVFAVHLRGRHHNDDDDDEVVELKQQISSMKQLLDEMRDVLEHQDKKIQQLEVENDDLRYQLRNQCRRSRETSPNERFFSPGTKFVGELAQLMDLPEDQYAPLSRIMDKHFARVSEIRNRHGWNDE